MAVRKLAARKDELMEKAMVRGGVGAALRAAGDGGATPLGACRSRAAAPEAPRRAQGGRERAEQPGVRAFLERLQSTQARGRAAFQPRLKPPILMRKAFPVPALTRAPPPQVPCAIGCSESAASVERGLVATGLKPYFEAGA